MPVFDKFDNINDSSGVIFSGCGSSLDPDNQFVFPILRAESTTASVAFADSKQASVNAISGE